MKKTIIFFLATIIFSQFLQAQAYVGKIDYDKKKQAAFVIEFPYSPDAVENAFLGKMEKMGYKGKEEKGLFNKDKGFRVYKNAYVMEISSKKMDYIIDIERKSRKDDDAAILYLIINKDGENAMQDFDADDLSRAKAFLNNLLPDVESADLEIRIKDQEEVVAKAEKKFRTLQSDKQDMENKIKKLQDDIKSNIKDQDDTQKEIEEQQKILEGLRIKRRN